MTTIYRMPGGEVDLLPIAHDAMARRGWIAPRLAEELATLLAADLPASDVARAIGASGSSDRDAELASLCHFIIRRARSILQRERAMRVPSGLFAGALFSVHENWPFCRDAAELHGCVLADYPVLPLASCDAVECFCSWRQITVREARGRS